MGAQVELTVPVDQVVSVAIAEGWMLGECAPLRVVRVDPISASRPWGIDLLTEKAASASKRVRSSASWHFASD